MGNSQIKSVTNDTRDEGSVGQVAEIQVDTNSGYRVTVGVIGPGGTAKRRELSVVLLGAAALQLGEHAVDLAFLLQTIANSIT